MEMPIFTMLLLIYILPQSLLVLGKVPEDVLRFLEKIMEHLKGVAGSGNKNWGAIDLQKLLILVNKHDSTL